MLTTIIFSGSEGLHILQNSMNEFFEFHARNGNEIEVQKMNTVIHQQEHWAEYTVIMIYKIQRNS